MEEEFERGLGNVLCRWKWGTVRRGRYVIDSSAACLKTSLSRKLIDSVVAAYAALSKTWQALAPRSITIPPVRPSSLPLNADVPESQRCAPISWAKESRERPRISVRHRVSPDQGSGVCAGSLTGHGRYPRTVCRWRVYPQCGHINTVTARDPVHRLRRRRGGQMNKGSTAEQPRGFQGRR